MGFGDGTHEDDNGAYVRYEDYARLHSLFANSEQENARLKAEVERLKEGNDCLGQMHDKEMERSAYLLEEFNRTTAWGRGLESDLSHARVEISFLKAEVERLRASSFVTAVPCEQYERVIKAGDAMADNLYIPVHHEIYLKLLSDWNAAKEGKPSV